MCDSGEGLAARSGYPGRRKALALNALLPLGCLVNGARPLGDEPIADATGSEAPGLAALVASTTPCAAKLAKANIISRRWLGRDAATPPASSWLG